MHKAWFALLLALTSSCLPTHAGSSPGSPPAAAAPRPVASESATSPAFVPSYSTAAEGDLLVGGAADAHTRSLLAKACRRAGLQGDGRLALLAEDVAGASQEGRRAPQGAFVSFHAHQRGLIEPTPQLWLGGASRVEMLWSALDAAVSQAAQLGGLTHCGGALIRTGGVSVMAVAFSGRFLELDRPLPQRVEPGTGVTFAATLASGYSHPSLAVTAPSGTVTRTPLPDKRELRQQLQLDTAGEHTVELLAQGPQGVSVIAVFPITVGDSTEQAPPPYASGPVEKDPTQVAAKLAELIQQERARRKLPVLQWDMRLENVALAHSQDMAKHHFVAHTSPTTGEADDRVRAAGLQARVVLENIARGYSAADIHQGLMESPGHRGNVLHPEARQLGIGVVAEREGDRFAFLVTELFAQLDATKTSGGR